MEGNSQRGRKIIYSYAETRKDENKGLSEEGEYVMG